MDGHYKGCNLYVKLLIIVGALQAYQHWEGAQKVGREWQYSSSSYLNNGTLKMVSGMRLQLLGELQVKQLIPVILFVLFLFCSLSNFRGESAAAWGAPGQKTHPLFLSFFHCQM
jgi:hypothetical protein